MSKVEEILESISSLTILEAAELKSAMEEKFGIVAAAGGGAAAVGGGEAAAEKTEFDVELTSAGNSKIGVIKVIRGITGLGLKEAKDLVESAPKVIKDAVSKEEAEKIKEELEAAGASVAVK